MEDNIFLLRQNDTQEFFKLIKSSNEMSRNPVLVEQQQYLSFIRLYRKGLIPNTVVVNLFQSNEDFGHILKQLFLGLNYYDDAMLKSFELVSHHYLRQYDSSMSEKGYHELYDLIQKIKVHFKSNQILKNTNKIIMFNLHIAGFALAIESAVNIPNNLKLSQLERCFIFAAILLKPVNKYEWENILNQSSFNKKETNIILGLLHGINNDYPTLLKKKKLLELLQEKSQVNEKFNNSFWSTYLLMILLDIHYINTRFLKYTSNNEIIDKFILYFPHSLSVIQSKEIQVGT